MRRARNCFLSLSLFFFLPARGKSSDDAVPVKPQLTRIFSLCSNRCSPSIRLQPHPCCPPHAAPRQRNFSAYVFLATLLAKHCVVLNVSCVNAGQLGDMDRQPGQATLGGLVSNSRIGSSTRTVRGCSQGASCYLLWHLLLSVLLTLPDAMQDEALPQVQQPPARSPVNDTSSSDSSSAASAAGRKQRPVLPNLDIVDDKCVPS